MPVHVLLAGRGGERAHNGHGGQGQQQEASHGSELNARRVCLLARFCHGYQQVLNTVRGVSWHCTPDRGPDRDQKVRGGTQIRTGAQLSDAL